MANKCMNCKADLREGAKFCQACGTKVPLKQKSKITQAKFCIKCGAPLKKGAKFCTKCGAETVKKKTADLNIYVDEPVISVSVSDQPPVEDIKEKPPTVEIIDQAREGKKIRQRPPKQIDAFDIEIFEDFTREIIVFSQEEIGFKMKCGLNLRERLVK
jgi:ribosomal protein L40E